MIAGSGRGRTHLRGGEGGCLTERCRALQNGFAPLHLAAHGGYAAVVEQLLAAGAAGAAAANHGTTPKDLAEDRGGECLAMFVAAEEKVHSIAFAMGLQERLGAVSVVRGLDPDLLRMVVELAYPPVDNVLEAEGDSDRGR